MGLRIPFPFSSLDKIASATTSAVSSGLLVFILISLSFMKESEGMRGYKGREGHGTTGSGNGATVAESKSNGANVVSLDWFIFNISI